MERRNRSLKALEELNYIDSLDAYDKAPQLLKWVDEYLDEDIQKSFDLELNDLEKLSEIFYKNISFLKEHRKDIKNQLDNTKKLKSFFK